MQYLEYLKVLKEERELTYAQIAELSDIPQATITRIYSGATPNPSFEVLAKIVIALGGSLDIIAGIKSENERITSPVQHTMESYSELLKEKDERIKDLKEDIKEVRREKHRFAIALACIVGIVMIVLAVDLLNGGIGFVRY